MKILVIGSGGREHALVWALRRSSRVEQVYSATTNAGILMQTAGANVDPARFDELVDFAASERIDLVVIGPEQPLVNGLVDLLVARGVPAFGPSKQASQLEGSKVFAKQFLSRHTIPTARYKIVETVEEGLKTIGDGSFDFPLVIKADGLAAGKGVIIADDHIQAKQAILAFLLDRKLGDAGTRLVIEECLTGREVSYLVFTDGNSYAAMPVSQDYKRAFNDDQGPNTGGMGAYSTPHLLDETTERLIQKVIVEPTLDAARLEGFPFRGTLYFGLMLASDGPKVLEYNVRFGDPETQAILRRPESDFAEIALAVAQGELHRVKPRWSDESSICVVLSSAGYPGNYQTGKVITGLDEAEALNDILIFHAGTKMNERREIITSGGRVLGVSARGATLEAATGQAYQAVSRIRFDGISYRSDIGRRK
ncbi:MAG: phosphoribosylamine--glycine ligase [Acidobacteria bacterium]|nr:phosphoribosylamine--glycine ligase [Acidobacteriota bacterium]